MFAFCFIHGIIKKGFFPFPLSPSTLLVGGLFSWRSTCCGRRSRTQKVAHKGWSRHAHLALTSTPCLIRTSIPILLGLMMIMRLSLVSRISLIPVMSKVFIAPDEIIVIPPTGQPVGVFFDPLLSGLIYSTGSAIFSLIFLINSLFTFGFSLRKVRVAS